ncbi:hypothetical protein [Bacillus altitudinis]|nr:hypothetical protein [Bacillus altitudinis]
MKGVDVDEVVGVRVGDVEKGGKVREEVREEEKRWVGKVISV